MGQKLSVPKGQNLTQQAVENNSVVSEKVVAPIEPPAAAEQKPEPEKENIKY